MRRFETEARTVGALDHPNLLVVFDVGHEGDVPYLVSELLHGETLRDRLRRQGTLPERQAVELVAQVVRGLAAAHARGFVHRDLKPENLFVTTDRRVKILDFGIAKRVQVEGARSDGTGGEALTVTGTILVDEPPPLPPGVSPALARILSRCLAKSRDDRFHTAHDLGIALELLDTGSSLSPMRAPGVTANSPMPGLATDVKFADWSPDGSALALVRQVAGRDRLEYPLGHVLVEPQDGDYTGLGFARVAPDGARVAFVEYRLPGSLTGRIAVVSRDGQVARLTGDYINVHGLCWRGKDIWFTAGNDQLLFRAICAVSPDGGAVRTITRAPGNVTLWDALPDGRRAIAQTDDRAVMVMRREGDDSDRDLSLLDASNVENLSTDGQRILFTETGQGGGPYGTVYIRGTDGSPAVRLGAGQGYALSPDGRLAACAPTLTSEGTPSPHLDLVPTGAGETRRIDGAGFGFTGARWLPGGSRLIVSGVEPGQGARLHVLELPQGARRALTPEGVTAWAVAPDGALVAARGFGDGIRLYPVDGSAPRDLPQSTPADDPIGWVHDGLLIRRPGDPAFGGGAVLRVDVRTGRRTPWADIRLQDQAGIMLTSSFRVTPDGRSRAFSSHRALSSLYVADGLV